MNLFMLKAIQEARYGIERKEGGPFGSALVKDGKIIGSGHNQVLLLKNPTCHGEMQAIRNACAALDTHDLSGCVLYTTGEPCPMCLAACLWANIEKVYYGCTIADNAEIGFRDEKFYNLMSADRAELGNYLECIDRDACVELFKEYKKSNPPRY